METRETTKLVWPGSNDGYKKFVPPLNFETEEKEEKKTNGFEKKRRGERKKEKNREKWKKKRRILVCCCRDMRSSTPDNGRSTSARNFVFAPRRNPLLFFWIPNVIVVIKGVHLAATVDQNWNLACFVQDLSWLYFRSRWIKLWFGIFWQRKCKFEQMKKNLFKNWKDKFELKIEKRRYEDIIFIN